MSLRHLAVSERSWIQIPMSPKVLGSDGIICEYLHLWVYPMFSMRV